MGSMLQGASLPISGNGGTVTISTPLIDGTQTWNNAGTTFTGIKLNISDTASNASSRLMSLQVGGVEAFWVLRGGNLRVNDSINVLNDSAFFSLGANQDIRLFRDAAGTLALRNGTNAQTFNVYNTYTDASNYERGFVRQSGGQFQVGTEALGTGNAQDLQFVTNGLTRFYVAKTAGGGHLLAQLDNTYDIGASGANRPRVIYSAGNIVSGNDVLASANARFQLSGRSGISSTADGNLVLSNNAGNNFSLLQFGGTTSSFPAIKRNAAAIEFRLADDTAFASIRANTINVASGTVFSDTADGTARLTNNAGSGFTGLLLGPSGTSYVRLKPSGVGGMLSLRLADDSADAPLTVSYVKTTATVVGSLPAAATAGAGARSFVTDALAPTFGAAVTGGGAVKIPVYSDGTTWLVG